ncbi:MAG: hypothetical protein P8X70_00730 [Nanoarchaeota archaeon]
MKKEKKELNLPVMILSVFGAFTLILIISFIYMSVNGPNYTSDYLQKIQTGEIKNPIQEFALMFSEDIQEIPEDANVLKIQTDEGEKLIIVQAEMEDIDISDIEKELVNYGAVILKLYNLHSIPFTNINPEIQINIDENIYSLEIIKGDIFLSDGEIQNPDIILRTTNEEIFKMIENEDYAEESISLGKTSIELVANKFILFSKGYLNLYNEFV